MIENEVIKTIMARRSIRKFKSQQISEEQLETILTCGFRAPSGGNCQAWYLSVIQDKELLDQIHEAHIRNLPPIEELPPVMEERLKTPDYNVFFHAPTVIMVSYEIEKGPLSCGILGQNMVIAAQSLGLGTCYFGGIFQLLLSPAGKPYLDKMKIPEGYDPCFMLGIGYPDETPGETPRDLNKYVRI